MQTTYLFEVDGTTCKRVDTMKVPSGTKGLFLADFSFLNSKWDSFSKVAVFKNGSVIVHVALVSGTRITVPGEVLKRTGELLVGVFGMNKSGEQVLTTNYALAGRVLKGVSLDEVHNAATPDLMSQLGIALSKTQTIVQGAEDSIALSEQRVKENATKAEIAAGEAKAYAEAAKASADKADQIVGGYIIGDGLRLDADTHKLSVDMAFAVERDNTKPVTSAAVYTEVGNIDALLSAILY